MSHVMKNPVFVICEQQRHRSACASAQSDQRLCYSLPRQYNISFFYIKNFKPLVSLCGCAGWFESNLVVHRFSRDKAQIFSVISGQWNEKPLNEPRHDKSDKMTVQPAKAQISLGIRPVWSESSLSAWRNLGSLATHWVHSEDSDQTGRIPRLIWVFAGHTLILLVLSCRGSFKFRNKYHVLHNSSLGSHVPKLGVLIARPCWF